MVVLARMREMLPEVRIGTDRTYGTNGTRVEM